MNALKSARNPFRMFPWPVQGACALLTLGLITTGCTLIKSKIDINNFQESTVIVGRIDARFSKNGHPIIVAARSMNKGKEIAHYTVLHDSGEYELMVSQGEYYIFAFWDKNSNLVYDEGEPAGQHRNPRIIKASSGGVIHDIDIVIPKNGGKIKIPHGFKITQIKPEKLYSRQAGAIVGLDDERFSDTNGAEGFWEPGTFFKKLGGNIFFLEKYNPHKIPILFIHGAGGTPKGWKYFVENIDRTRYQPWFFYYPTGARIDSMAYLLFWKLLNLQMEYKFNKLYITAHSMGGLVARSFIVNFSNRFPYVKLLVSLATPWGGDKMAEYGVQQSPVVVPSWRDMQPQGDFIKSLYRKKMPEYVKFYLLYGYKGNRNPFSSNNDGTINLSSILDNRPQSEAAMAYAFNEDHASIAYSKEVLKQYKAVLSEYDEKYHGSHGQSKGYLKIHFTYNYTFTGIHARPMLILTPIEKKEAETVIFLSMNDNGRALGPFPAGEYKANLVTGASAGIPDKKYVPVSIANGKTSELEFVFAPEGLISGCVTRSREPDYTPGMPEYVYRSKNRKIHIKSVFLKGNGIARSLKPVRGKYITTNDYLLSNDDFCYNECFAFRGLPAGTYGLTIEAEGYKTAQKEISVTPGIPSSFQDIELTSD